MPRLASLVCACLFTLAAVAPVVAQQRLFVRTGSGFVELDPRLPSLGTAVRRFTLSAPPPSSTAVVSFGGGRFLAWGAGSLTLFDTDSGALNEFTFPGFVPGDVIGTDGNATLLALGGGPNLHANVLVANARSGSVRFIDVGPAALVGPAAYASETGVVFVAKRPEFGPFPLYPSVDVIAAASGSVIKTIDVSPAYAGMPSPWATWISTNATGTRLFVTVFGAGTFAFDVFSGSMVASTTALSLPGRLDEGRNRLVALGDGRLEAVAADTLAPLGVAEVPLLALPPPELTSGTHAFLDFDASSVSATLFVLEGLWPGYAHDSHCTSRIHALHADTGHLRRTVNLTNVLGDAGCGATLLRITESVPPQGLTADVSGRRVTLRWRAPFGATRYEIGVGTAPGLASITTFAVSDAYLVVDDVPPGTYYVRVRAANSIGASGASQEVRVVVP